MSIKNEKLWELYQKWLMSEGRVADVISTEVQEYERCIAELTRINKKQRNEIAGLRRQNDLLLDLLEDVRNGDPSIEAMPAYRAAIDGGALED